ncbi:Mrx1p [Lachancea thermotolerans CBS 6340]|uniref:KLTH0A04906p n=1 Tax=Lachancea thermotolerans (strain ATCC 56472 / CBS 6340 / NRRL Y-8284) TaxID=559295 RepID=C5DBS1_LACTC|nr:KLTH0A04906p [Lachancea thermotolerans CBS 6340]CAR21228.1 KLTH0A04906p [Lachancea thermotolerans CBS 6340]
MVRKATIVNLTTFLRGLHVQVPNCASQLRDRITHFERNHEVLRKSRSQLKRIEERRRLDLKNLNKTPYSQQHARHVLKRKYEVPSEDLDSTKLGPTSESDLRFLKLTHDKRLLYTILGVTGEQLRDSKLIAADVSKFLSRNQLEKAVFLARLAKSRGVVGMNKVIEHFCQVKQDAGSAIDMYNWRKKWDIPPNEFTHTILFDGLANVKQPLSEKQSQRVLKIAKLLLEREEMNIAGFNASLSALANSVNVEYAFELFDARKKQISPDAITYTILLRALSLTQDDKLCMARLDAVMASVPRKFLDGRVVYEYCHVLHNRKDSMLSKMAIKALANFFDINIPLEKISFPAGVNLPSLQFWDVKQRFDSNKFVADLFFQNCERNKLYELAWETYKAWNSENPRLLELPVHERMIRIVTAAFPTKCAEMATEVFKNVNLRHRSGKNGMLLVYRAFERQAGKKFINDSESNVDKLLTQLFDFSIELEGKHWKELGTRVLNWKAWMFCWNVVNKANERRKISNERAKWILDQYLRTILTGQTNRAGIQHEDHAGLRHVGLESVRFLSSFADHFKIKGESELNDFVSEHDRQFFLYRRLLLRFKDRILEQVKILEGRPGSAESVEESIKQTAEKLLATKLPDQA